MKRLLTAFAIVGGLLFAPLGMAKTYENEHYTFEVADTYSLLRDPVIMKFGEAHVKGSLYSYFLGDAKKTDVILVSVAVHTLGQKPEDAELAQREMIAGFVDSKRRKANMKVDVQERKQTIKTVQTIKVGEQTFHYYPLDINGQVDKIFSIMPTDNKIYLIVMTEKFSDPKLEKENKDHIEDILKTFSFK